MYTRYNRLLVHCRQSVEEVAFSDITWFHGQISSGKSSILRLIDFCFGGDFVATPALSSEFIAAELQVKLGTNEVSMRRERGQRRVAVDWVDENGEFRQVIAPIDQADNAKPIVGDLIYTLSDLILHLYGYPPIKVRKNKYETESSTVRLSIRDFLWFCYLDEIDQDVFKLDQDFKLAKARDVYRFAFGFHNREISELEDQIGSLRQERRQLLATAKDLEEFLAPYGFASTSRIKSELALLEAHREKCISKLGEVASYSDHRHPIEDLQRQCRAAMRELQNEEDAYEALQNQLQRRTRVRAEFVSAIRKLDRVEVASNILGHVEFVDCPSCGLELPDRHDSTCKVCGQHPSELSPSARAVQRSILTERISELDAEVQVLTRELSLQLRRINQLQASKFELDRRLEQETRQYDPPHIAAMRQLEHELGQVNGRISSLAQMMTIPQQIEEYRERTVSLQVDINRVDQALREARLRAVSSVEVIHEYERMFLETLIDVRCPLVTTEDRTDLDYGQTWKMYVLPRGDRELSWYWLTAGSTGKRTLYNTCLTLALHHVTATHNLPLPTVILLDSPMKNIGQDVDKAVMLSFYKKLYELAATSLGDTQIIIVDKEFVPPPLDLAHLDVTHRYMTNNDPNYPPLISYYSGH